MLLVYGTSIWMLLNGSEIMKSLLCKLSVSFLFPNRSIITALFNSGVDDSNDHAGELLAKLYKVISQKYPKNKQSDQCLTSSNARFLATKTFEEQ
jgi:hypothetical protein